MPKIEVTERQILDSLDGLSPAARKEAVRRLVAAAGDLDRFISRNRERMEKLCRERGMEFGSLSEEQREALVDDILHES